MEINEMFLGHSYKRKEVNIHFHKNSLNLNDVINFDFCTLCLEMNPVQFRVIITLFFVVAIVYKYIYFIEITVKRTLFFKKQKYFHISLNSWPLLKYYPLKRFKKKINNLLIILKVIAFKLYQ